ncbi:MAG TPA: hypothetical protein VL443_24505 [Cyclobacteriaceae bacterium]|jgi:hypothetical protein|nr:hypothetical protein [Cyclobacteriaceae bacterium]
MSKTLGGVTMAWNAISQDYSIIECLECLYQLCDAVSISFGGDDGTTELVSKWIFDKLSDRPFKPVISHYISQAQWLEQKGREKLSYFSNIAIELLNTDYFYYQQADEITHQDSFPFIRQAIETNQEAFLIHRLNCWHSAYTVLNVEHNRKPVSTHVIRLAKKQYRCIDDAESVMASASTDFIDQIRMYHVGFVRDKDKHLVKIKNMQEEVFLFAEADRRIHDCPDGFDAWKFGFKPEDVEPIKEPLPKFIKEWAEYRLVSPFKDSDFEMAKEWLSSMVDKNLFYDLIIKDQKSLISLANNLWWNLAKQYQ